MESNKTFIRNLLCVLTWIIVIIVASPDQSGTQWWETCGNHTKNRSETFPDKLKDKTTQDYFSITHGIAFSFMVSLLIRKGNHFLFSLYLGSLLADPSDLITLKNLRVRAHLQSTAGSLHDRHAEGLSQRCVKEDVTLNQDASHVFMFQGTEQTYPAGKR